MIEKPGRRRRGRRSNDPVSRCLDERPLASPEGKSSALPDSVLDALNLALADERHALATYQAVLMRFGGLRPFVNIARAEQRHIDALLRIYARYGATVPGDQTEIGGPAHTQSIAALCQAGVAAETENVRLYDEKLLPAVASYPDISSVLRALRDASAYNHLPAFERCASRNRQPSQTET